MANKVYFAETDADYGGIYIAAKTAKEAKTFAQGTWIMDHAYSWIDLRVTRCWSVKETKYEGILDIFQINELGLTWWCCEKCNDDKFKIINEHEYMCTSCGARLKIPYI